MHTASAMSIRMWIACVLVAGTSAFNGFMLKPISNANLMRSSGLEAINPLSCCLPRRKSGQCSLRMTDTNAARDELINKLISAAPYELPSLVSQVFF